MSRWVCPACDREFGRAHQSHTCVPGCTVEESFAGRPAAQRAVYDAVLAHLETLGPVHVDPVRVGVFLKRDRTIVEVRPMATRLSLELVLPRTIAHSRVVRTISGTGDRVVHILRLRDVAEVDDELRAWLTEAYDAAG